MPPSDRSAPQEGPRRLHPTSILFSIWRGARYLVPAAVVLFLSKGKVTWEAWGLVFLIPVAIGAVIQHLRYRYWLTGDELVILTGILGRYERHIPFHRIQDLRLTQNPVHRLLGVADVKIETASGSEAEATMRVLSMQVVDEIRRGVFRGDGAPAWAQAEDAAVRDGESAPAEPASYPGREIVRFSLWDTVKAGLTQGRGWIVVGALVGIAWEAGEILGFPGGSGRGWKGLLGPAIGAAFRWLPGPLQVLVVIPVFLVLLRLLSVAWALVSLHRFSLTRTGDGFRMTTGLLTRISATIPAQRVQAVKVTETTLQRLFRLVSVMARTAGGGGEEESDTTRRWLAPSLDRHRLAAFLAELVPTVDLDRLQWMPVDARARRRLLTEWLLVLGLASAAMVVAGVLTRGAGYALLLLPAALLPLAFIDARRGAAALGYALTPDAIVLRRGWWLRRLYAVESGRMQSVTVRQSPFDRRYDMAVLSIDTAGGGSAEGQLELPYLPASTARELQAILADRVARTRFLWSGPS